MESMSYKSMEGPKVLEKFSVSTNISSLVKRTLMCLVAQLCLTLCDPMDCGPPGSSVHGILRAGILEWVAILFSRGSSRSRDRTHISCSSCITGGFFTTEPPGFPKTPLPVLGPPTPLVYVTSLPPGSSLWQSQFPLPFSPLSCLRSSRLPLKPMWIP